MHAFRAYDDCYEKKKEISKELQAWYDSANRRVEESKRKVRDTKQAYSSALVKALDDGKITQEEFDTRTAEKKEAAIDAYATFAGAIL
jgi:uncharacterized protein YukE